MKGKKHKRDNIIFVKTEDYEPITIPRLLGLIRLFARNDRIINEDVINATGMFFFEMAVKEAIRNEATIEEITKRFKSPKTTIQSAKKTDIILDKLIDVNGKLKQMRVMDF